MSEPKTNVPKLRFPGFTDPWEQCKFSELYELNNERNDGLLGYSRTLSVATMTYKGGGSGAADSSLASYKVLRLGDIAFEGHTNKIFRYGRFVLNDAGQGLMSPRFTCLRPILQQHFPFWKHYINYEPLMRPVLVSATKAGTMMNELVVPDLMRQSIPLPSLAEQQQIGTFFQQLDTLITLHQRKSEHLKLQKRGLLQKMFPRDGSDRPEIRFPGFTDPWEQRKLGEEVDFFTGLTYSPSDVVADTGTLVLRSSNVQGSEIVLNDNVFVDSSVVNSEPVRAGDIVVVVRNGSRALIGKHAVIRQDMPNTVIGAFMTGIRSKHSSFTNALLNTSAFDSEIKINLGATINQITGGMFSKMSFMFPESRERHQIGTFFQQLDTLITLHQRKLDNLKKQKKALLQQMFV